MAARWYTHRPVKVSVENRWNSSGKHVGGAKNKRGVVFIWSPRRRTRSVSACVYWPCPSESFRAILSGAIFLLHTGLNSLIFAARVSSDNPRLKAFCRVAPSVLFKVRAIVTARVLLFASFFRVRYEHLSLSNFAVVFSCFSSLDHPPKNAVSVAVKKT